MGPISEDALEHLSLIVNITNHIQLKGSKNQDEEDTVKELFPSFIWVLRDFSLKLEDTEGNKINSDE